MQKRITKLVLPVAGLGKRLLPLTKHTPKNLIKVCGKPLIEYVLEEAAASGTREVVLIINPKNRAHFERYLRSARCRFPRFKFHIREQETPGGNGHAIVQAYDLLKGTPFVVRFCDDVVLARQPVTASLVQLFQAQKAPIVLLERVPWSKVSRFGVVATTGARRAPRGIDGKIYRVTRIVEKPKKKDAPSNLTIVGGYVLTPKVVGDLKSVAETLPVIANDALPLAVALQMSLIMGGKVYGWEFRGKRLDCGTLKSLEETEKMLKKL